MSDEFVLAESAGSQDGEFTPIPDGTFVDAELVAVEATTHKYFKEDNGDPKKVVNFEFRILDGEYKNRRVWGNTSQIFSSNENCKLKLWTEALLGVDELAPGFKLKLGDLVGQKAGVMIDLQTWNDKTTQEERSRNQVSDVLPVSAVKAARPQPTLVDDEEPF